MNSNDGPSRLRLIAAIAIPVLTVIAVLVGAVLARSAAQPAANEPLPVVLVDQPGAAGAACTALMAALPDTLGAGTRRPVEGGGPGVAAWGHPAITLRCGLPTPAELTCSSSLIEMDGVDWLQLSLPGTTTYLVADRAVRIALTMPDGAGTAPIQEASKVIGATLTEREVCSGGALVPVDNN